MAWAFLGGLALGLLRLLIGLGAVATAVVFSVLPALRAARRSVRELPNGYELELPNDAATLRLAADWAAGERVCCPFFDIELRLEREGGPLWLRLSGRDGVKQILEAEGGAWLVR